MLKAGRIIGWILMILGGSYLCVMFLNLVACGDYPFDVSFDKGTFLVALVFFFGGGTIDQECKKRIAAKKADKQN